MAQHKVQVHLPARLCLLATLCAGTAVAQDGVPGIVYTPPEQILEAATARFRMDQPQELRDSSLYLNSRDRAIGIPDASYDFRRAFDSFNELLSSGDDSGAAAAIAKLRAHNEYERTWLDFAQFQLAARTGDKALALRYLERSFAAAHSIDGLILMPAELERTMRRILVQLYIELNYLQEALATLAVMEERGDSEGAAAFASARTRIEALADNAEAYPVAAQLDEEGSWRIALHKRQFYLDEIEGRLAEAVVTCDRRSQTLAVEALVGYTLPAALGDCSLNFSGEAGTRFVFMQYRD